MRPQGISPRHLRAVLQKDNDGLALLAIAPREREARPSLEYTKMLGLIAPHLARAVALNRLAASARFSERAITDILQAFAAAAFLLDHAGRIVAANARGEALIRAKRVLRLDS